MFSVDIPEDARQHPSPVVHQSRFSTASAYLWRSKTWRMIEASDTRQRGWIWIPASRAA